MVTSPYDSRAAYASATLRPRTRASSAAARLPGPGRDADGDRDAPLLPPGLADGHLDRVGQHLAPGGQLGGERLAGERLQARLVDGQGRPRRRARQLQSL